MLNEEQDLAIDIDGSFEALLGKMASSAFQCEVPELDDDKRKKLKAADSDDEEDERKMPKKMKRKLQKNISDVSLASCVSQISLLESNASENSAISNISLLESDAEDDEPQSPAPPSKKKLLLDAQAVAKNIMNPSRGWASSKMATSAPSASKRSTSITRKMYN